jgi:uncharacterized protein YggE
MLDLSQIKQHKIAFLILAIIVGIVLLACIVFGMKILANKIGRSGYGLNNNINQISFAGEGKVYTKPDIAFVDVSVVTQGTQIKDVQDANTKKMNKVVNFLKSSGIDEKDIKTTNYNLYPQYTYENNKIPQIIGYQINQTLSIKIRDLDKVGSILQGGVDVGLNQVNFLYFGVENDEQLKEDARKIAIDDAKEKAKTLASQLGVRLIKITGFSDNTVGYPVPMYNAKTPQGMGGGETPNIETGQNEITVNVTITYEIK